MNLTWAWEPFKAAKTALANTLESANVEKTAIRARDQLHVSAVNLFFLHFFTFFFRNCSPRLKN